MFAHHPNCDLYDHHVFKLGSYRFCVGCTGVYSAIIISFIIDIILFFKFLDGFTRVFIGIVFFIPGMIQLYWKSTNSRIKFIMRYSLGISAYLILSGVMLIDRISAVSAMFLDKLQLLDFTVGNIELIRFILILGFIAVIIIYNRIQASKRLLECYSCDQEYITCKTRYKKVLEIDEIVTLLDELPDDIANVIHFNRL